MNLLLIFFPSQNLLLEKVNEAPETVNTMEKKADSAHWSTNTWVEHAKVEKVVIEEENIVKTPPHITDAAEKFSFSSESSMTSSNVHMQK